MAGVLKEPLTPDSPESALPVFADKTVSVGEMLQRGVAFHQAGDLEKAELAYSEVLKTQPGNTDALQFMGVLAHQNGDSDRGIALLKKALKRDPKNAGCHNNLGSIYNAIEDYAKAEFHFRKATAAKDASAESWSNLGLVYRRRKEFDKALEYFRKAASLDPGYPAPLREIAGIWLARRNYTETETALRSYLNLVPDDVEAVNNLAYAVQQQGRFDEAEKLFQKALEAADDGSALGYNLRLLMTLQGRGDEARELFRKQLRETPEIWTSELGLALNLARRGLFDEAMRNLRDILDANSETSEVWNDVGMVLLQLGKLNEAIEILRKATEIDPGLAVAHNNLASAYSLANYPYEAIKEYKAAIKAQPEFMDPYVNLCRAFRAAGDFDQANFFGRAAISLDSYDRKYFPNMVQVFRSTCDFDALSTLGDTWENCDSIAVHNLPAVFLDLLVFADEPAKLERFFGLVRRWAAQVEAEAENAPLPEVERTGAAGDKLRIGFLSSDLRSHSVARFLLPLMEHYDRDRFEFYCYTPVRDVGDAKQEFIKRHVDKFAFVEELTHWEIAREIQKDEVDILFELNGFTYGTRLEALAYKPAPVQISWLGYPFTCGLKALDHVLMDRFVVPEGGRYLTEEPVMMPDAWVCFGKFPNVEITPGLPMDYEGRPTFGTLNSPYKYTPHMIGLWARVMNEVPNSRFLMVRPEARSYVVTSNIAREFAKHGVDPERLYFFDNRTERKNHLSYYNAIDVSLDTFPLTGGTTTCEAIWMGVPVVSLVGKAFQQRISYSALMQVGLEELCTFDEDSFVAKAVELATDRERLLTYRHGLRPVMSESPLCDHDRFIHQFQEMLVQVAAHHKLR